jgi:hypothetical protein
MGRRDPWRQKLYAALDHKDWPGLVRLAKHRRRSISRPGRLLAFGKILAEADFVGNVR